MVGLLLFLPLLLLTSGAQSQQLNALEQGDCVDFFKIESEETGAWHGLVTITADSHVVGWEVHLKFDASVDSIESPLVTVSGSGTEWKLHSKGFDEDLTEGQILELRIKTIYTGAKPGVVTIGFNGINICGEDPEPTPEPGGDCSEIFTVESQEDGAWHGLLTLTAKVDLDSWKVIIGLDNPLDSLETPLGKVSGSGTTWTVDNKSFDGNLPAGQVLQLRIKATYSGSIPDVISVNWNGDQFCEGSEPTPEPGDDCSDIFTVESQEDGAWHGLLALTAKEDIDSWKVVIGLDNPLDSLETPLGKVSGSGTTWTVDNKSFDGNLPAGQVFELRIKAVYSSSIPTVISVNWNGASLCEGDGPGPTTQAPADDCSEKYSVESEEAGAWHGLLPVTAKEDITSWKLELRFDSPLTSLASPLGLITGSGTDWVIANKAFDGELAEGQVLELRFQVSYAGSNPAIVGITFNDDNMCSGGSHSTQPTQPTHPTQPTQPPTDPPRPTDHPGKYPYGEVLAKSILFYEAERSGPLPSDNRVPWRGNSAMNDAILGGYYDAGDHVKFGFPMASMTTILAWGGDSFYEGYEKAGQLEWFDKCLKWSLDYFMAAHKSATELVGQVGDGNADHGYWGRPEEMTMNRPAWSITANKPGSDLAGETAAALAAGSVYFSRRGDTSYAADLLSHARTLFDFADQHRGVYTDAIPNAAAFYQSWSGYEDELFWSAAWLGKATGEQKYIDKANGFYNQWAELQGTPSEFSWDDKTAGAQLLMWELTQSSKFKADVQSFLNYLWNCETTPKGLIWMSSSQWGSLRYASNVAGFALQAANLGVDVDNCINFAESQINYILGDTGRSYVCGWGVNPPVKPHHRASSCPDNGPCGWNEGFNNPGPNYQTLNGAMVGGPDHSDNYVDDRGNFKTNEVATDYNAGFQSSLAGLNKIYG